MRAAKSTMCEVAGTGPDLVFQEMPSQDPWILRAFGVIFGPIRTLHFDAERRRLVERTGRARAREWAFDDLGSIVVEEDTSGDGTSTWGVAIGVARRHRRLRIADTATEARAEVIAADVERLVRG
jgi:hypothetical protein